MRCLLCALIGHDAEVWCVHRWGDLPLWFRLTGSASVHGGMLLMLTPCQRRTICARCGKELV